MPRPKNSKNKPKEALLTKSQERRAVIQKDAVMGGVSISSGGTIQPIDIDLSAKILDRIYHPEDYPHDCPNPREDMDGFLRWLSNQGPS